MTYNNDDQEGRPGLRHALSRLACDEFAPLTGFLKRRLDELYDTLARANDATAIYRLQGRIGELEDFLDMAGAGDRAGRTRWLTVKPEPRR